MIVEIIYGNNQYMIPEYINFPTKDYLEPIERASLPEKICTIEIVKYDPVKTNPKISLAHTDNEFKTTIVVLPDESTILLYLGDPIDLKDESYRRVEIAKSYFLDEDGERLREAISLAKAICLNWLGLDYQVEDLSLQRSFFADDQTLSTIFEESFRLISEEDALVRLAALARIEASSITFTAGVILDL